MHIDVNVRLDAMTTALIEIERRELVSRGIRLKTSQIVRMVLLRDLTARYPDEAMTMEATPTSSCQKG